MPVALLYVVDLDGVDHESDLYSSPILEPVLLLHFFGLLNCSLELRVHDLHKVILQIGKPRLQNALVYSRKPILVRLVDSRQPICDLSKLT